MSNSASNSSGGIGFSGLLTLVFIVLKLCGAITWPWIWVLSPIWIGLVLLVAFLGLALLIAVLAGALK
jgi:hypothetical protein